MTAKEITSEELDEMFDNGEDVTPYMVEGTGVFFGLSEETKRVSLNMPAWMVDELDATAKHLAASRQSIINMWLSEKLEEERKARSVA